MVDLDLKDRKILYQLDLNCRQSNTQIGKKVGLSKQVVDYRIKRMEEEGIIRGYYTVIDAYKIGYFFYRFYINFQYATSEIKKEIIQHFIDYKNISTVASQRSIYELIAVIWVKDVIEFYDFWEKTLIRYGDYFSEQKFSLYIKGYGYPLSILINEHLPIEHKPFVNFGIGKRTTIDKTDYILLNHLALHARDSLLDLSNILKSSSQTVNYRIKNLQKNGVIQAFRVTTDYEKIGYKRIKLDINLKEHGKRIKVMKFIENLPNLLYFSNSVGLCDLEFELIIEDSDELTEIIDNIEKKFPGAIRNYKFYGGLSAHIETFLPKIDFK